MPKRINYSLSNNETLKKFKHLQLSDAGWQWVNTLEPVDMPGPRFESKAEGSSIYIYDAIGPDFWGFSASQLLEYLPEDESDPVTVHLNSPGGDVFEGVAIYNLLNQRAGDVTIQVDGYAASIASIIAMAGDTIRIAEAGQFMIHNPWTVTLGDSREHIQVAELLDSIRDQMVGVYEARTGLEGGELRELLDAETWLTAEQAVDMEFADELIPNKAKASAGLPSEGRPNYAMMKARLALLAGRHYK